MPEMLLINPRTKRKTRKRRTAAQKAATRKMIAANRRRKSPTRRRRSPTRRRTIRARRNPIGGKMNLQSFMRETLVPSAIGATGALGLDFIWGRLPLPAQIKTGGFAPVAKLGGAMLLGMVAGNFTTKKRGEQIAAGAVTVIAYDAIKGMVNRMAPGMLSDSDMVYYPALDYVSAGQQTYGQMPGYGGMMAYEPGQFDPYGMGAYTQGQFDPYAPPPAPIVVAEPENGEAEMGYYDYGYA